MSLYRVVDGTIYESKFGTSTSYGTKPSWLDLYPLNNGDFNAVFGKLRLNHHDTEDVTALFNITSDKNQVMYVKADYQPTETGDTGGMVVWQDSVDKIELLESVDTTQTSEHPVWKVVKKDNVYDFYAKKDNQWVFIDTAYVPATKAGVVLKSGTGTGYVPLDIDRIVVTKGELIKIGNLYPDYTVKMYSNNVGLISTKVVSSSETSVEFFLEDGFLDNGTFEIYDQNGNLIGVSSDNFYGGDILHFGSDLRLLDENGNKLSSLNPNDLGLMKSGSLEVKLKVHNPSLVTTVDNVLIQVDQYNAEFGYQWVDISLDNNGQPEEYGDVITISSMSPDAKVDMWLRITQATGYLGVDPLYFELDITHD